MKTWFFSDPHYGHSNICLTTTGWSDKFGCRDFSSVDKMNDDMVNVINTFVAEDDDLFCLGDWSFGGIENIWNFRKRINCKNLYLVPGNHDHHIKKNAQLPNCYKTPYGLKSWPEVDALDPYKLANAEDLFLLLPEIIKLKINKQEVILSHYPIEEWENMDRGSIHLHGHTHCKLDNSEINQKFKRFDVSFFREGRHQLYESEALFKMLNKRENKKH